MSELFFVLKTAAITVGVILLLQMRVGSTTLEQRSLSWMRQSAAIEGLRGVADGAVTVSGEGAAWAKKAWQKQFGSSEKANDAHVKGEHRAKRQKHWEAEAKNSYGEEVD